MGDSRGLIASWNDSNDVRPVLEPSRFDFVFAWPPKIPAREKEIKPDSKRNGSKEV